MVVNPVTGLHVPYLDSEGLVTVGYGTLIDPKTDPKLREKLDKYKNGMTEADASKELHSYIKTDLDYLNQKYPDKEFTINESVALLGLMYNTGKGSVSQTELAKLLHGGNSDRYAGIVEAWVDWANPERRKRELEIFYNKEKIAVKNPINFYGVKGKNDENLIPLYNHKKGQ